MRTRAWHNFLWAMILSGWAALYSYQLNADTNELLLPSSAQTSQAILGEGYDSSHERFVGACVSGNTQYAGAPEASITFERSLSASELSDSLGFAVGGKARFGVVSASAAARFAADSSSNDYSEVTVYSADYHFKNVKLDYTGLTAVGKLARQGAGQYTWENWEKTCGHHYVEQIRVGAKILISVKVEFSSKEDKKAFAAEFKIKGPAFSASGELKKASRRFGKTAAVSIRAYQLGGDVARLSSIFGRGNDAKVDVDGKKIHALLVCSMDHIDACTQVLDHALSYATNTDDPTAFPNQLSSPYDPKKPTGLAELAYITKPWSDLAFYPPPALIAELIKASRRELSRAFEHMLKLQRRVVALSSGPFRLSSGQLERVEGVAEIVNDNIALIMNAATVCYSEVEKCPGTVAELNKHLRKVDPQLLDIYPEVFSQWCDALDSGLIKKSAKNTVKALYEIALSDMDLAKITDKCAAAERVLSERRQFDLSAQEIEGLGPLAFFPHIEVLNLAHNHIVDIQALRQLPALRELNINNNEVRDLTALTPLVSLEKIRASNNRIDALDGHISWPKLTLLWLGNNNLSDISALKNLAQLSNVRLHNNRLTQVAALSSLAMLKRLDLSHNNIADFEPLTTLGQLKELRVEGNPGGCPSRFEFLCQGTDL